MCAKSAKQEEKDQSDPSVFVRNIAVCGAAGYSVVIHCGLRLGEDVVVLGCDPGVATVVAKSNCFVA